MSRQSYAKTKGRNAEAAVVSYLHSQGFTLAERRRLAGCADKGDISGFPSHVVEVKAEKTYKPKSWLAEMDAEMFNAQAPFGAVWFKINGVSDPARWGVLQYGYQYAAQLKAWYPNLIDCSEVAHGQALSD